MPRAIGLLVVVWLVCALNCISSVARSASCWRDSVCGPKSLLDVCQKLRVAARLDELTSLCGYDEKSGTSLLGLQNAAKAKGLQAVGMKISVDELAGLRAPAIAHLWGSHFVVVEPEEGESIKVTSPPNEPRLVKKEDFKNVYSGFALLVAKDASLFPTPKPEGADLRVDEYVWDFGALNEGEHTEHLFKCRSVANKDLVISKVDTSCGDCLVPLGGPQTIPVAGYVRPARLLLLPGRVNYGNPRRTEEAIAEVYVPSFEEDKIEVTIHTNDPDQPLIKVPVYAYVE